MPLGVGLLVDCFITAVIVGYVSIGLFIYWGNRRSYGLRGSILRIFTIVDSVDGSGQGIMIYRFRMPLVLR